MKYPQGHLRESPLLSGGRQDVIPPSSWAFPLLPLIPLLEAHTCSQMISSFIPRHTPGRSLSTQTSLPAMAWLAGVDSTSYTPWVPPVVTGLSLQQCLEPGQAGQAARTSLVGGLATPCGAPLFWEL